MSCIGTHAGRRGREVGLSHAVLHVISLIAMPLLAGRRICAESDRHRLQSLSCPCPFRVQQCRSDLMKDFVQHWLPLQFKQVAPGMADMPISKNQHLVLLSFTSRSHTFAIRRVAWRVCQEWELG